MKLQRNIAILFLSAASAVACSSITKDSDNKSSEASPSPPPEPPVDEPVFINSTYLTQCSSDTGESFVEDIAISKSLAACVIKDDKGNLVDASEVEVSLQVAGQDVKPELITKQQSKSSWHVGFRLDAGIKTKLEVVSVAFTPKQNEQVGARATANTQRVDYDWRQDPHFKQFIDTFEAIYAVLYPPEQYDKLAQIARFLPISKINVLFVSDELFRGDFTVEAADAYCSQRGAKVDSHFDWKALLSTGEADAKVRTPITGVVLNFIGNIMSELQAFWDAGLGGAIRYSESGNDVSKRAVVLNGEKTVMTNAWVGTREGGGRDPERTCANWMSAASDAFGATIDVQSFNSSGGASEFGVGTMPCSNYARILCVSYVR